MSKRLFVILNSILFLPASLVLAGDDPSILFVTQMPIPSDFTTVTSTFGNHLGTMQSAGRGGDLWIRYGDGQLCNLTATEGWGSAGAFQGEDAISVRDPSVHWSGTKALFSMVIGAPKSQFEWNDYYWQLYEVSGFESCSAGSIQISKVPNQPVDYHNVSPVYASDDQIIFVSDRIHTGKRHLYPQLDEYEEAPTNTGLWMLNPVTGVLDLINHAPSGSFTPTVDSYGRIIFTRWDHLQRDQQADDDEIDGGNYGTFNWEHEGINALPTADRTEVFPEPRSVRTDILLPHEEGHSINHFFPWQIDQDGTGEEVLNHLGRHELHSYFNRSFNNDNNLVEFIDAVSGRFNPNEILNMFQIREDPGTPGYYLGIDAPEFNTHGAGQVMALSAPPGQVADQIAVTYITHRSTFSVVGEGDTPPVDHSGHYRDPVALTDGTVMVVHTPETHGTMNMGTRPLPVPRYDFRIKPLVSAGNGYQEAGSPLIPGGMSKTLWYWDPDVRVDYSGLLWELDPVEVIARTAPLSNPTPLPAPESQVFAEESVNIEEFKDYMSSRDLALVVMRNVTSREGEDRQQPFNLRVPGGEQTTGASGNIYDIAHMQFTQGDLIRGLGGSTSPSPGRRVLAQWMHDPQTLAANPENPSGPEGSVPIALDGSVALFVPAHRAMAWQSTAPDGTPVVRERYWITFQPGEIRTCDGCHGINTANQAGEPAASQPPQSLRDLLQYWQAAHIFEDGFESGDTSAWSLALP